MRVPSSNTASTFTSRTMSGTPGSTSSTVSTAAPAAAASISRAPSRAASHTVSAISAVASGTLSRKPARPARRGQLGRREDEQPIAIRRRQAHVHRTLFSPRSNGQRSSNKSLVRSSPFAQPSWRSSPSGRSSSAASSTPSTRAAHATAGFASLAMLRADRDRGSVRRGDGTPPTPAGRAARGATACRRSPSVARPSPRSPTHLPPSSSVVAPSRPQRSRSSVPRAP